MLVLSVIDALRDVFGATGAKDKRKISRAANDASAESTTGAPEHDASEQGSEGGQPEAPGARVESAREVGDRGREEAQATSQGGAERGLLRRRRAGGRRDTPGWRAWEAR